MFYRGLKLGIKFLGINKVISLPTKNLVVVMNHNMGSLWKGAIMDVFTPSCFSFPVGNEENDENSQPEYPVFFCLDSNAVRLTVTNQPTNKQTYRYNEQTYGEKKTC